MTMKRISPVNQAGSWQLEHYQIVVGKSTGSGHPVQILRMPSLSIFSYEMHWDINACEAARAALRQHFGSDSDEYREFLDYYGYDCKGVPQQRGTRVLDGLRSAAFEVYLGRRHIDTVYYDSDMTAEDVRTSLINHDSYNSAIRVYRRDLPKWTR